MAVVDEPSPMEHEMSFHDSEQPAGGSDPVPGDGTAQDEELMTQEAVSARETMMVHHGSSTDPSRAFQLLPITTPLSASIAGPTRDQNEPGWEVDALNSAPGPFLWHAPAQSSYVSCATPILERMGGTLWLSPATRSWPASLAPRRIVAYDNADVNALYDAAGVAHAPNTVTLIGQARRYNTTNQTVEAFTGRFTVWLQSDSGATILGAPLPAAWSRSRIAGAGGFAILNVPVLGTGECYTLMLADERGVAVDEFTCRFYPAAAALMLGHD
jgi:hypothetical protein